MHEQEDEQTVRQCTWGQDMWQVELCGVQQHNHSMCAVGGAAAAAGMDTAAAQSMHHVQWLLSLNT
jgi:hypothetical protein